MSSARSDAWHMALVVLLAIGAGALTSRAGLAMLALVVVGAVLMAGAQVSPSTLILGVAALVPFVIVDRFTSLLIPGQAGVADALLAAFAISALVRPKKNGDRSLPIFGVVLVSLLVCVAAVSTVNSVYLSEGLRKTGRIVVVAFALYGAWRSLDARDAYRGVQTLFLSSVLASLLGFAVTAVGLGVAAIGGLPRMWAGLVDPNHYGTILSMVIVGVVFASPWRRRRGMWFVSVGVLFAAEAMTLSRGAALGLSCGFAAALMLGLAVTHKGRQLGFVSRTIVASVSVVCLVVILLTLAPGMTGVAVQRYAGLADPLTDPTGALRIRIWEAGLRMLRNSPWLGVGPGGFSSSIAASGLFSRAWEAHNSILETAVETGYIGAFSLLGLLFWTLGAGFLACRHAAAEPEREDSSVVLSVGLYGAMVAGIVSALFVSNVLYQPPFVLTTALFIASLVPHAKESDR